MSTAMLAPVAALIAWTILVLSLLAVRRFKAAFAGQVRAADFKIGQAAAVPARLTITNRAFMNLTEVPPLFYVVCICLVLTDGAGPAAVALAWAYVALRVAHSLIYLTYNHVLHRFAAFAASNLVLTILCGLLAARLWSAA